MITTSGRRFTIGYIPEGLTREDIAIGLSRQSRFCGHTEAFYSVLCHSIVVMHLLPGKLKLAGLLHDAAEAVVSDVPTDVKPNELRDVEMQILAKTYEEFGVPDLSEEEWETIHRADRAAMFAEAHVLNHPAKDTHFTWSAARAMDDTIFEHALMLTHEQVAKGHPKLFLSATSANNEFARCLAHAQDRSLGSEADDALPVDSDELWDRLAGREVVD